MNDTFDCDLMPGAGSHDRAAPGLPRAGAASD